MRRLTLIRHALTAWNADGRFQGHTDVSLSDDGRRQARRLARHVAGTEADAAIYASPSSRALETAHIAFPNHRVEVDARLRELNFGAFEGHTQAENERDPDWQTWFADPFTCRTPGGESYQELRRRAVAWMDEAHARHDGHVVAVTHSGTIQMLLTWVLGVEHPRWRKRIYLRHAGVSRVLFRDGEMLVERVNDTRHLTADGADPFLD